MAVLWVWCVWILALGIAMGDVLSDLEAQCRQLSTAEAGWRVLCNKYTNQTQPMQHGMATTCAANDALSCPLLDF